MTEEISCNITISSRKSTIYFCYYRKNIEKKVKKNMHIIEAILIDDSSRITATWFNQAYLLKVLIPGLKILVRKSRSKFIFTNGYYQVQHTEVMRSSSEIKNNIGLIMPVYSLTSGIYQIN